MSLIEDSDKTGVDLLPPEHLLRWLHDTTISSGITKWLTVIEPDRWIYCRAGAASTTRIRSGQVVGSACTVTDALESAHLRLKPFAVIAASVLTSASGVGLFTACSNSSVPEVNVGTAARPVCLPESDSDHFFDSEPFAALVPRPEAQPGRWFEADLRLWPSQMLYRMGEQPLSCGNVESETYRFIWLHPFVNAKPTMIRASGGASGGEIRLVRLNGLRGLTSSYEESMRRTSILSPMEWASLREKTQNEGFWTLRSAPEKPSMPEDAGLWILEGRRGRGYHQVVRFGGLKQDEMISVSGELLRLAKIELDH